LLREALTGIYPNDELPLTLTLNYLNTPEKGMWLTASVQISVDSLVFGTAESRTRARVDIIGAIYNDQGKPGDSFSDQLTITASSPEQSRQSGQDVVYNYRVSGPRDSSGAHWRAGPGQRENWNGQRMGFDPKPRFTPADHEQFDRGRASGTSRRQLHSNRTRCKPNGSVTSASPVPPLILSCAFWYTSTTPRGRLRMRSPTWRCKYRSRGDRQPDYYAIEKDLTEGVTHRINFPTPLMFRSPAPAAGHYLLQVTTIDRVSKSNASQTMRFEIE
jgi:hypothetical protein